MASSEGDFQRAWGQNEEACRLDGGQCDRPGEGTDESEIEPEAGAFGQVLHEMASHLGTVGATASEELQRLIDVARQRAGQATETDAVAAELVAEMLSERLGRVVGSPSIWRALTASVAGVLCEDPPSRERLERLWSRLQEYVSCPPPEAKPTG